MTLPAPVNSVLKTIGSTPVVRLQRLVQPGSADVVVKLEYFNPTGSYKDRMALAMIEGAERRGTLKPGMRVIEYTGGKVTPALFDRFKARTAELLKEPNTFWTDQFNNADALEGYAGIGRELFEQVGCVDAFVGAVGSAGMLMGVAGALKAAGCKTRIIALEPATSPLLTKGKGGPHRVEGTAPGFWPPHLKKDLYDEARAIDEETGREIARRAAREEGIFAGTSSGVNLAAALEVARELGPGKVVATVAVDTGLKYLTGDLYKLDQ